MNNLHLSDDELVENFQSASPWFVGLYMETFLNNLSFLSNRQTKNEFTADIHRYDPILIDENILDIYIRVESLLNIIKGNRVLDALKMVLDYDTDTIYDIYAREEAIYLLALIKNGKITLPGYN
ncbi:MAG TPA: hypothetical protein DDY58_09945 [Terrisporobacter glycolicus]|uniref:Uncharacterized protein n=1 Tax=Terrisporobacter hibernicus TaxID=2813371 RepID=A0AAX2ZD15_9FIRM|nr:MULTISPECIES: hypothetical protein [Terrisporobacter]MBN9648486.1 hypothetical protein [Terrisporobacter glycolicus]UEL46250.1 hypothetical protein JW646_11350 [Terrisporobacter hibernicus]UPA30135.1 hypothetical protein L0P85_16405 [Terrisporobacter glycolicus]HBI92716.1 hypothetical protein [Terrisporobacter hibernicus]